MRQLGNLISKFIMYFEESKYLDKDYLYPTLHLSRFYTPNNNERLLNIKIKLQDENSKEAITFVIYTDPKTMKTYYSKHTNETNSEIQGPFDGYIETAKNIEAYLLIDFDYIKWNMSYEIPLEYV